MAIRPAMALCSVGVFTLACQPSVTGSRSPSVESVTGTTDGAEVASEAPRNNRAERQGEETPDRWCDAIVHTLDRSGDGPHLRVQDVIARTDFVAVAFATLAETDCSSVGHRHLAYRPADREPQLSATSLEAYRSVGLDTPLPPSAPFYLVGSTSTEPRTVNLQRVCIAFERQVSARVEWVLPVADASEAERWQNRLSQGACGRPPG